MTVFNVDAVKTTKATTATTIVALAIIFLIYKSEARSRKELQDHIEDANGLVAEVKSGVEEIKNMVRDTERSTLRLEISQEIDRNPHNHDTILKMREKYFCEMGGFWYNSIGRY